MSNIDEITRTIADERGKISRLQTMLQRQEKLLRTAQINFELRHKISPERYAENKELQGNERAFWDYNAIERRQSNADRIAQKIEESQMKIESLNSALEAAQQAESEDEDDYDMEM